jgi:hypothetical protein
MPMVLGLAVLTILVAVYFPAYALTMATISVTLFTVLTLFALIGLGASVLDGISDAKRRVPPPPRPPWP